MKWDAQQPWPFGYPCSVRRGGEGRGGQGRPQWWRVTHHPAPASPAAEAASLLQQLDDVELIVVVANVGLVQGTVIVLVDLCGGESGRQLDRAWAGCAHWEVSEGHPTPLPRFWCLVTLPLGMKSDWV